MERGGNDAVARGCGELAERENVLVTGLDVIDDGSIGAAVERAEERFGAIDVLLGLSFPLAAGGL